MNEYPTAVWWTLMKSKDDRFNQCELPFMVQVISVQERNEDGSPRSVDIKMMSFDSKPTDIVFSVAADSLTDMNNNPLNVDRELALTAHDNVLEFPSRVWVG